MKETDRRALQEAKVLLENPSLAARLANVVGGPVEKGLEYLPARIRNFVSDLTGWALRVSLRVANFTTSSRPGWHSSRLAHRVAAASTGSVGGFFGAATLAVELAVSTTIIMRAIATIARENDEDTASPKTQMACLEVFALGGRSESDDGTETGYYAVRNTMAKAVANAVKFLAEGGKLADKAAPALVKLIARVTERFSIQVSEKILTQAPPVIGAVSAASLNLIFTQHFQDMATGHFTVRRLERKYGPETVKEVYAVLPSRPT